MSRSPKTELVDKLDDFYLMLLDECRPDKLSASTPDGGDGGVPSITYLDRLRTFAEGVRWVAVKNRIEVDDQPDAFGKLSRKFHGKSRAEGWSGSVIAEKPVSQPDGTASTRASSSGNAASEASTPAGH